MDQPFHALIRFGLGRRGAEPLPSDPSAWLRGQLSSADPGPPGPSLADGFAAVLQDREDKPPPGTPRAVGKLAKAEIDALVSYALVTDTPFRERLVRFWANHFTVAMRGPPVAASAGDFVRTAIRPYVTARFGDMLLAVMRHPAMLAYLDNAGSIGPNSPYGLRSGKGLNENLARESLELHTVTPAAGYTQADVTSYARILTGWSLSLGKAGDPPGFRFRQGIHEPGSQTVMGQSFPEGEQGGIDAFAFLATHPSTYHHLATKLVQHFGADDPAPADVRRVEGVLRDTKGDLHEAALSLIMLPSAWNPPLGKLRSPQDYVLAAMRAADLPEGNRPDGAAVMRALGQPMFGAPFPIGWPDRATDWSGPEAIMRRVDWAYGFGNRTAALDPAVVAQSSLGPLLGAQTVSAIQHAGSRGDAMTLLFTSPEFQRR